MQLFRHSKLLFQTEIKRYFTIFAVGVLFISCTCEDPEPMNCDFNTIISPQEYSDAPSDFVKINHLEITENCLYINFSSSGCSGDTWEIKLIDSGVILESNPPQRNLRLSLKNDETCLAYLTKELSFDISNLQVEGSDVHLRFSQSNANILYQY